jgi:hypothetical protein
MEEKMIKLSQEELDSIIQLRNSIRDNTYIENLKTYLDQLDVRRKTNWRTQFGWLDQDFSV